MKKLILTVGPAFFKSSILTKFPSKNYIFRINGAHNDKASMVECIEKLRKAQPDAHILIDLPGNKIRLKTLESPIPLEIGKNITLKKDQLNYPQFCELIHPGDTVLADDSRLKLQVQETRKEGVVLKSQSNGSLKSGKGLHVRNINEHLPFFFERDLEIIETANKYKITYLGLSFVRDVKDILLAREVVNKEITLISKVETRSAVKNIDSILTQVDHILIDRGDLSADIGLEKIPMCQKFIIEKALFYNKRVFLATEFLKYMTDNPLPSIAEVTSLYSAMKQGIYGIQLSEETSTGLYPEECVEIVNKILEEISQEQSFIL
ncbi:MAG: hypothetical protein HYW47_01235 [Deltaproteobacteria bacterium]|nr:hypothetical protein [Deltaproteobacteria bacterium]